MLTLDALKPTRLSKKLSRQQLADLTGVPIERLQLIELRTAEPWFDEAVILSRALCVEGVNPLIASGDLTSFDCGDPTENDMAAWRSGLRSPLSLACRVARRFGLDDPLALSVSGLARQIWQVIEANDRHPEAPGLCPWCMADRGLGQAHGDLCLPNNLWAPHERVAGEPLPEIVPKVHVKRTRGQGLPAKNLKACREATPTKLRQKDVAHVLGVHANYYARIERGEVPLTPEAADKLIELFGVEREQLYKVPANT